MDERLIAFLNMDDYYYLKERKLIIFIVQVDALQSIMFTFIVNASVSTKWQTPYRPENQFSRRGNYTRE